MAKRVIVVSDSHGDTENLRCAFKQAYKHGTIDIAVFLGDGASDFEQIKQLLYERGTVCYAVKGNNDWTTFESAEQVFMIDGVRFFACHGHTRQVKYSLDRLWYAARERDAQVVLYGHTHRERYDFEYGIHLINPGAICERYKERSAYAEVLVENGVAKASLVKWET